MLKKITLLLIIALLSPLLHSSGTVAAASLTTQYRVYQNDQPLKEFATQKSAIQYAQYYSYSHVESIKDRQWVWDNLPKYKVYINGESTNTLEYRTLQEAKKSANQHINSYIRDLESTGWVYERYAKYQLYQGDNTYPNWSFYTLEEAQKEAKKWTNSHIIDLETNHWIWDRLTAKEIQSQRTGDAVYEIQLAGNKLENTDTYPFLKDAIIAASKIADSEVYNVNKNKLVHSNIKQYQVYAKDQHRGSYASLSSAVAAAKKITSSEVRKESGVLWTNIPYLTVYQGDRSIKSFYSLKSALIFAKNLENSTIINQDGRNLWTSHKNFIFMGWNGSSTVSTIESHIANTQGLDIDSPTWYYLADASGTLTDTSNAALLKRYAEQGIDIHPLVHNQFDKKLTSAFLADESAQTKFIASLMDSLKAIGAKGVNIDFEEVAGPDRQLYTTFIKNLTAAAHKIKLTVSIDLLRGELSWNHLTAYDHVALGEIVDYIVIMAYDEHWSGSKKAGSVSSLDWAEKGIIQYLDYGIPRQKLILGIPFYVRDWTLDANGAVIATKAILMKDINKIVTQFNATSQFDAASGQYKYTYEQDGQKHMFWAETEDTVLKRIDLAKKYDLAGIAAWRLGYEDASLWEAMLKLKEK